MTANESSTWQDVTCVLLWMNVPFLPGARQKCVVFFHHYLFTQELSLGISLASIRMHLQEQRTSNASRETGCLWTRAYCSVNLESRPTKSISCHRRMALSQGFAPAVPRGQWKDLYSAEDQVTKKWFVVLDWIDHLFPEFLFPSFTHYTPPPDGRGHLLAPTFIALANGNTLAAAFPEGWLIYLLNKRLKFSKGQKN